MTCRFEELQDTWQTPRPVHAPHARRSWTLLLAAAAALSSAACGDDADSDPVTIEVTAPGRGQVLTLEEDDTDPDLAGLQFDVKASSSGLSRGTTLNLFIDGERRAESGRVNLQGDVTVEAVTLPLGRHTIHFETTTGSASSDPDHEYILRGIEITSPSDGATITSADDTDEEAAGVQIDVSVASFGVEMDEEVVLLLDDEPVGEPGMPDEQGELVFGGIDVNNGTHTLQAQVGEAADALLSAEIEIVVQDSCPSVTFLDPRPSDDGAPITRGGEDQCPSGSDPFTTDLTIATDAEEGLVVQLRVNGQQLADGIVTSSAVTFEGIALGRRTSVNELEVEIETAEDVDCPPIPFPGGILVDCAGVDCTIASPMPVEFTDDGATTLYLNAALRGADGFEIAVESDEEIDGRDVELVVDGNTRRPLRAGAEASGDVSIARFSDLDLSEGAHTFEALCTDAQGNVTSSGEVSWTVDVTSCEVEVTDPAAGVLFVPADDEDGASSGTQIGITATVSGGDCVSQRAAPCDLDDGISGIDFASYDGASPLVSTITLDDSAPLQTLCLEIADRAGNVGLGSVAVGHRASPPAVLIESPSDGAKYNALGGGEYTADADPGASPTACDAAFSIACSELGADVQLFHDGADTPFATAQCEEPGASDPALPSGYAGRAQVTVLFDDGDGTATIVARQTLAGSSGEELVGSSAAITIEGDCRRPGATFSGDPCAVAERNQLTLAQAAARDFAVYDNTLDMASVSLSISNTDGTTSVPAPSSTAPASPPFTSVSWTDVDFGGAGTVTITATARDDFENVLEFSCMAQVVPDLPSIVSFTSPAEGAVLGSGSDCDPGTPAVFEVRVQATVDKQADRVASVLVNGVVASASVPIDPAGSLDACVPVPDNVANAGGSTVTLRVESTLGSPPGFAEESRTVNVVIAPLDEGIVIEELDPPALDDLEHRDGVRAEWIAPTEDYPGQLTTYEMRCAAVSIEADALDPAKESWWDAADPVDLDGLTPADEPEAIVPLRPEETRHCVLRARDIAGQHTPVVESTDLTLRLRQVVIATGGTPNGGLGAKVAPAGDVDNDGIDDLLVSGFGRTELIFGTAGSPATAPRVVFTGLTSTASHAPAALGDFNGDGLSDFAIGNSVANSNAGHVSIFFGRPQEQWPSTPIDLEAGCNADICLEGDVNSRLGRAAAAVGDFDDDGRPDLALGSSPANQVFVVLGNAYEVRPCSACRAAGESCVDGSCVRNAPPQAGQPSFWKLRFSMPTGDSLDPANGPDLEGFDLLASGTFGVSLAGMGDFDTVDGADLAIGASSARQVHFLSGREYSGPGMESLATTDLGLPDVTSGTPDGLPISAQDLTAYGFVIANLGDFFQVTGTTGDAFDLGVARVNQNEIYVVPGDFTSATDSGFSAAPVRVSAAGNVGQSIATSWDPVLGLLGDLDGDGTPELCIGTRTDPHDVLFWYPDQFAAAAAGGDVLRASGNSVSTATTDTQELAVQYVGDINGDGHLDIAVGDIRVSGAAGQVVLVY